MGIHSPDYQIRISIPTLGKHQINHPIMVILGRLCRAGITLKLVFALIKDQPVIMLSLNVPFPNQLYRR
jgi:hypothetical protein